MNAWIPRDTLVDLLDSLDFSRYLPFVSSPRFPGLQILSVP